MTARLQIHLYLNCLHRLKGVTIRTVNHAMLNRACTGTIGTTGDPGFGPVPACSDILFDSSINLIYLDDVYQLNHFGAGTLMMRGMHTVDSKGIPPVVC